MIKRNSGNTAVYHIWLSYAGCNVLIQAFPQFLFITE